MTKPRKWVCAKSRLRTVGAQWVTKNPILLHLYSKDSDQSELMYMLVWVFSWITSTFLGLLSRVVAEMLMYKFLDKLIMIFPRFSWANCKTPAPAHCSVYLNHFAHMSLLSYKLGLLSADNLFSLDPDEDRQNVSQIHLSSLETHCSGIVNHYASATFVACW